MNTAPSTEAQVITIDPDDDRLELLELREMLETAVLLEVDALDWPGVIGPGVSTLSPLPPQAATIAAQKVQPTIPNNRITTPCQTLMKKLKFTI